MSKYRYALASAIAVALAMVFSAGGAEAITYTFNGSDSGTSTAVPIDLSGASCAVVNLVEVCTTTSSLSIYAGKSSGDPFSGPFTGQFVSQTVPVVGTGCSFAPTKIAACTIGSVFSPGNCPSSRFAIAAHFFTIPSARITGRPQRYRSLPMGKFSTERCVCAPHRCSWGTATGPSESLSTRLCFIPSR